MQPVMTPEFSLLQDQKSSKQALIDQVMGDLVGFWKVQIIYAGSKLGIFDYLKRSDKAILEELSKVTQIPESRLKRLMDALVVMGYINGSDRSFELGKLGKILVDNLVHAPALWAEEQYSALQGLTWSMKEGKCYFEKINGMNYFEFLEAHPEKRQNVHQAIEEYAALDYEILTKCIDASKHKTIMDVGGGSGTLLKYLLKRYPCAKGILFDRDSVIELASRQSRGHITRNLLLKSGNFFQDIPKLADAIILCRILHDWNDQAVDTILRNVHSALPEDGTLYVVDLVKPDIPNEDIGVLLDLVMLCVTEGKERTKEEFQKLLMNSKFSISRIETPNYLSVITAKKE